MRYLARALIVFCCLSALPAMAQEHAEHGGARATASAATPADRDKKWKANLAKPSLAISAAFDENHRLWQVSVRDRHLVLSHSDDRGASFSAPIQITAEAEDVLGDGENRPKIVVRKGAIYVSYTRGLDKPMSGDIRFTRSLDGGQTFSVPLTVNDNREIISHRFEAMTVNDRGQVFLAWLDKRDLSAAQRAGTPYRGAATYYAVSDDGGASFRANVNAADHSCECCRVSMAQDGDGTPVILWRHVFGTNVRDHALMRLDGKSTPTRATFDNWEVDGCPHHGPSLSIAADGVYHLVWFNGGTQRPGLAYARSADGGKTFSAPQPIGEHTAHASHADVLSRGKSVYVVWKEFDGQRGAAYAMSSHDGGAHWSPPKLLATSADNSDHPFLIADGERVYLSWNRLTEGYRLFEVSAE
jgi:hypothetical protein